MSNGTISLLITFLMKFEGKKLQRNKKYNHPQFSIIWCSSSFLLVEVCRGGRMVQILWERCNLWLFQTKKAPIPRRLPAGPCRHFYKPSLSQRRCSRTESKNSQGDSWAFPSKSLISEERIEAIVVQFSQTSCDHSWTGTSLQRMGSGRGSMTSES